LGSQVSSTLVRFAITVLTVGALLASTVRAQSVATRGNDNASSPTKNVKPTGQQLDVTLDAAAAYDTDLVAQAIGPRAAEGQVAGSYADLQANADYRLRTLRATFVATGASALRYYGSAGELRSVSHSIGVGVDDNLTSRTSLMINGTAAYSPSYLYGLFPTLTQPTTGASIPSAPDYNAYGEPSYSYGASVSVTHSLSVRDELAVTLNGSYTDYVQGGGTALSNAVRDLSNYDVNGEYSHHLSRRKTVVIGFHHREGQFGSATRAWSMEDGVTAGVQVSRPLSATRNLTFAFGLGSSAVETPETGTLLLPGGRQYLATANASAGYDFGRSWNARGTYRRGLEYIAALRTPVFTDGVTIETSGLLSRRTAVRATAAYSTGEPTVGAGINNYTTYTGTLRIQRTLTRTALLYGEYFYYFYDFGSSLLVQPGLPTSLERNGVRAGVTLPLHAFGR
jgi:hypothetical protein